MISACVSRELWIFSGRSSSPVNVTTRSGCGRRPCRAREAPAQMQQGCFSARRGLPANRSGRRRRRRRRSGKSDQRQPDHSTCRQRPASAAASGRRHISLKQVMPPPKHFSAGETGCQIADKLRGYVLAFGRPDVFCNQVINGMSSASPRNSVIATAGNGFHQPGMRICRSSTSSRRARSARVRVGCR